MSNNLSQHFKGI